MINIWLIIYNFIFLPFLKLSFLLLSFFNPKVKRGLLARKTLFQDIERRLVNLDLRKKKIWFHSASMGEFEQAKPIIEKLKSENDILVFVSFFSPSGYENNLKYSFADLITYIPLDIKKNSFKFINLLKPDMAIFMRYDIWPNIFISLNEAQIPFMIVDATMRENSKRKLPLIKLFHTYIFKMASKILTVTELDSNGFKEFNLESAKILIAGDTRFDRVYQKSLLAKEQKLVDESVLKDKKVITLGSSWEADEEVVLPVIYDLMASHKNIILFIVPHEPTAEHVAKLESEIPVGLKPLRFSKMSEYKDENIIIVDSIGKLLTLYCYAHVVYVGGSFKQGIHNVLEPAVYGIPVVFGPKNSNSHEAQKMKKLGCGFEIKDSAEAKKVFSSLLNEENLRINCGKTAKEFVDSNTGATEKITKEIYKFL